MKKRKQSSKAMLSSMNFTIGKLGSPQVTLLSSKIACTCFQLVFRYICAVRQVTFSVCPHRETSMYPLRCPRGSIWITHACDRKRSGLISSDYPLLREHFPPLQSPPTIVRVHKLQSLCPKEPSKLNLPCSASVQRMRHSHFMYPSFTLD